MTMRRAASALSVVLLVLASIAVAQAALLLLLVVFSSILQLQIQLERDQHFIQMWQYAPYVAMRTVAVHQAGIAVSTLFTAACGVGAAVWRFRQWRPA
jgi:hypothetical protein